MRRRPCRCGCVSVPSVLHPSAWAMACCPLAWLTRIRALGARGFSLAGCWLKAALDRDGTAVGGLDQGGVIGFGLVGV